MKERGLTRKRISIKKKFKTPLRKTLISLLALITILSGGIFWTNAAEAAPQLKKVGPINEENGFPLWYKDSNDVRLQLCLDPDTPGGDNLCALDPAELDNPDAAVSFPNNFPHEAFYMLASSEMETASGGRAVAGFQLEAAFSQEVAKDGDQIVFGRVRIRVDGLITGETYTVTHPYGVDKFVAEPEDRDEAQPGGPGEINFTEDIGIAGGFEAAKQSRIGTFLVWKEGDGLRPKPEGYIGDPNFEHPVVGSPYDTNFFKIEGPGVGQSNGSISPNSCGANCIQTDLFSLMGKEATTAGVDILRATYSQDTTGEGTIDVFASTEDDAQYTIGITGNGVSATDMKGTKGQYFGRVPFTGAIPTEVTVTNKTDNPVSIKKLAPVDHITGTAKYDTNSDTLYITAASSDKFNRPTLTAQGFGEIPASGTLVINKPEYIPPTITVTSSAKGRESLPVNITADPAIANAGAAQTVKQGSVVTLDGSASTNAAAFKWEQVSGPSVTLSDPGVANPTFTFPKQFVPVSFKLTVTDAKGQNSTNESLVTITPAPDKLATQAVTYSISTTTLNVTGTSDVFGPDVSVTVFKGSQSLGTAVVGLDGKWTFTRRGITFATGDTINIVSTSGGKLTNVPVSVRTR